jgi:putative endonuclease
MGVVTVYVYILRCADGSYYVGKYQGADLAWRVSEHNTARYPDAYTAKRRPVELVWADWFPRYDDAVAFERRLKGWSRAKKEALIRGDEAALRAYSRRGFKPSSLHPEEARSAVTKEEGTRRSAFILRRRRAGRRGVITKDEGGVNGGNGSAIPRSKAKRCVTKDAQRAQTK